MKARITANQLADLLAGEMDIDAALARNFVAALFAETAATLESGRPATIKGFGEFLTDGTFIPDEALADEVNAPFSAFEPTELAEGVTEDMLADSTPAEKTAEPESEPQPEPAPQLPPVYRPQAVEVEPEPMPQPPAMPEPVEESEPEQDAEEPTAEEATPAVDTEHSYDDHEDYGYDYDPQPRRAPLWLIAVIFTVIGFGAGYIVSELLTDRSHRTKLSSGEQEVAIAEDTLVSASAEPIEAEPEQTAATVTDTVRAGYYFTTMARRHYGDKSFWVYIYEENAASRGFTHPERVAPGTVVTIPPREKYGIDPDNPESVKAAKGKAYEIYSRCQ